MGIQCAGTMKSEDMEVTDDLLVHGDAEVLGNFYAGGKIVPQHVILNVPLDASSVNQWVFVADAAYELDTVELAYTVKSTGASTFDLKKSTSVQAPASGATMLTGTISLAQTANTVYAGTKHGTEATRRLADGDKMSVCFTGDVTGLAGGVATIRLFRV